MEWRMFLVLHGQTEWNRAGRVQGHADSPLTDEGRQQAATVARTLRSRNVRQDTHAIICSPIGRTYETAKIIGRELGFEPVAIRTDDLLKEVSLGQWEGHTHAEVLARWPERLEGTDRHNWYFRAPGGETHDQVRERLDKWLTATPAHDNIVVVTHGVASRVLRGLYGGHTAEDALGLEVARDAVFHLSGGRIEKLAAP
jgi:broad specificity phosphatase PhoE